MATVLLLVAGVAIAGEAALPTSLGRNAASPPDAPSPAARPLPPAPLLAAADRTENMTVDVGTNPATGALDAAAGTIVVANTGSGTVSVLNASDLAVVDTLSGFEAPYGVAYDPVTGDVYVAVYGANAIDVLNGRNYTSIATITLSGGVLDLAVNNATGELYATLYDVGDIAYINVSSNTLVGVANIGGSPDSLTFDDATGTLLASNDVDLYELNTSSAESEATIPAGASPYGLAADPAMDEIYVADAGAGSTNDIAVLNETSLAVVGAVNLSGPAQDVAYDPVDGDFYATLADEDEVALINASTGRVVGHDPVGPDPESVLFDTVDGSVLTFNYGAATLTALASPIRATATASPDPTEVGVPTLLALEIVGGFPPYGEFAWSFDNSTPSNGSGTFTQTFDAIGEAAVNVTFVDADGVNGSAVLEVPVGAGPTVGAPTAPASRIDVGQALTLTAAATGGDPPYNYSWSGLPQGCTPGTAASAPCLWPRAGSYAVQVQAIDALGATSALGPALAITVVGDPGVSVGTDRGSADAGQAVEFLANLTGGVAPFTFAWSGLPPGCPAVNATPDCVLPLAGTVAVVVVVADARGEVAESPVRNFTVDPDPTVTINASATSIDAGGVFNISAAPGVGSNPIVAYNWSDLPTGCAASGASVACVATATTETLYRVTVEVTDTNGAQANSTPLLIDVGAALAAGPIAVSGIPVAGSPLGFAVSPSGGISPYAYAWRFGDGGKSSGASPSHTFSGTGVYTVRVWVNDSGGGDVPRTLTVTIGPAPTPAATGPSGEELLVLVGAGVVVAGGASAVVLRRRRRPPTARSRPAPRPTARRSERPAPGTVRRRPPPRTDARFPQGPGKSTIGK